MKPEFASFPDASPLWIFASPVELTEDQESDLRTSWSQFAQNWRTHGQPVRSEFALRDRFFLVVVADNEGHSPSGCSIDSAYRFLTDYGRSRNLDLLDRNRAYYRASSGEIRCEPLSAFKDRLRAGEIRSDTAVFQTGLSVLSGYRQGFEVPLNQSWAAAFA